MACIRAHTNVGMKLYHFLSFWFQESNFCWKIQSISRLYWPELQNPSILLSHFSPSPFCFTLTSDTGVKGSSCVFADPLYFFLHTAAREILVKTDISYAVLLLSLSSDFSVWFTVKAHSFIGPQGSIAPVSPLPLTSTSNPFPLSLSSTATWLLRCFQTFKALFCFRTCTHAAPECSFPISTRLFLSCLWGCFTSITLSVELASSTPSSLIYNFS